MLFKNVHRNLPSQALTVGVIVDFIFALSTASFEQSGHRRLSYVSFVSQTQVIFVELPVMRERFTLPCTSAHPCGVYLDVYGAYKVLRSLISGRKEGKFGGGGLLSWLQSTHRGMLISGSDVHGMHFFTKFLACDDIAAIR
nr:PREDICTED: uncharacterized protein LOC105671040 isoform X1 [Linepithema humile]